MIGVHSEWERFADRAIQGERLTFEEALSLLKAPDDDILAILHAAFKVRKFFFGKKVKLNMILNAKSGLCPEDCAYCSQSIVSRAPVSKYSLLDKDTMVKGAFRALELRAGTYCIVASGRGPTEKELEQVIKAVKEIKRKTSLKVCACLGLLTEEQAKRLKEAGVDRYNHNLNTSREHYSRISTTHTYQDRVNTVQHVKMSGISPCSGIIVGMGESDEDIVEMAFALRELDADSIPVNFLNPIPGTPLENQRELNPIRCLKILALFRLVCPSKEIRASGGREFHLRSLQPMALYAANSIFIGDYLTTKGQRASLDYRMIEDLGFEIEP